MGIVRHISNETEMEALGADVSAGLAPGMVVFLRGDLGAGKTTWVRGLLRGLGYSGAVKSPTYTLLEPYYLDRYNIYHFDLYRLRAADELEDIAYRDYLDGSGVCCVEWPERGAELLPPPDCEVHIRHQRDGRQVELKCHSALGEMLCAGI